MNYEEKYNELWDKHKKLNIHNQHTIEKLRKYKELAKAKNPAIVQAMESVTTKSGKQIADLKESLDKLGNHCNKMMEERAIITSISEKRKRLFRATKRDFLMVCELLAKDDVKGAKKLATIMMKKWSRYKGNAKLKDKEIKAN